jgi:hypothetical protein
LNYNRLYKRKYVNIHLEYKYMFYIHIIHLKPYVYTTQNKSFYFYSLIGYIEYKELSTKDVYMLNQSDGWIPRG